MNCLFAMMTAMGNYNRHLGERGDLLCHLCHHPCIHLWKCVKPRAHNFNKQTTHKPVISESEHPIHLFSIFLSHFGRASVNQPAQERTDKDPNNHHLNTFLHPRSVSNQWPPKHQPNKTPGNQVNSSTGLQQSDGLTIYQWPTQSAWNCWPKICLLQLKQLRVCIFMKEENLFLRWHQTFFLVIKRETYSRSQGMVSL